MVLDDDKLAYLGTLSTLAQLHQPHNLEGVHAFRRKFPLLPQVGNDASACAVREGKSIATTMGFSALDGLMMGTRSGSVDPGVLLHLLRNGWSADKIEHLLYKESGLRGVSGISADMRTLHASTDPDAMRAVEIFIHRLVRECGALTACLRGLDVLAFTGGIGEHDAPLRRQTCEALAHLGIRLDDAANRDATGELIASIHAPDSGVEVWVIATDEGRVAAGDAARLLNLTSCFSNTQPASRRLLVFSQIAPLVAANNRRWAAWPSAY